MPGGAIKPIPANIECAIKRVVPDCDWGALQRLAEHYQLESEHDAESPAAVRARLDNIIERAIILRRDLLLLREESQDALGDWSLIQKTAHQLTVLVNAAKAGHNGIEARGGRPGSLRQSFVRSIAAIVEKGGYPADGKPKGPLVAVVSDLLDIYGDTPADVPALVRSALREKPTEDL